MPDKFGDKIRLEHMLDAINKIQIYVTDFTPEAFMRDERTQDACIRQLQIIGEACNKISKSLRQSQVDIEWNQIIGLRHIIIHEYTGIDSKIIWDIIEQDLPKLNLGINSFIREVPEF